MIKRYQVQFGRNHTWGWGDPLIFFVLNVNLGATVKSLARKWMDDSSLDEHLMGGGTISTIQSEKVIGTVW